MLTIDDDPMEVELLVKYCNDKSEVKQKCLVKMACGRLSRTNRLYANYKD